MNEIEVIRYLLDEIETEIDYNKLYDKEKEKAIRTCDKCNEDWWKYYKYMPERYSREPRQSVIKDNAKMIRRLALKIFKEG